MPSPFNRILILGRSGAGKSTLTRQLAVLLGLPAIHLDCEYWKPGWVATPPDQFDAIVERLIAGDRWIMDGNFARTLDLRLSRADLAIHLDFPRWRCLWGIVRRVIASCIFDHPRPDMADGCAEQWDWEFVEWVWNFRTHTRPLVLRSLAAHARQVRVITPTSPFEMRDFLASAHVLE